MSSQTETANPANRQIARAAGIVMVAFILSNLVGLLAKTMTARAFGTGAESEAFFAANRFSEVLFNLVAGGALGSAFIPTFTGLLAQKDRQRAWQLASAVANLVMIVLVAFSLLTILFSRQVVHYILAPGFSDIDPAKEALTAELLRIQIPSAVIFGLSGLVMGILNAHQRFLLPAIAPAMYQVGWVAGVLVLSPRLGVRGLSLGILLGSCFHLLVQIPQLLKLPQAGYKLIIGLNLPSVREVMRLMAPRLLGVAVVQLNFLLNTYLASLQSEGSVTAISLAFPLMLMPQAVIAQSIAIAALPTFSAQVARSKFDEMRSSLAATLRGILLLSIPSSVGLILLRKPIVALLYQGGKFSSESTDLVAWALLWYAAGLVGHCIVEIISRAFYALHDTKTPVFIGVGAMSLNLVLSILFSAWFERLGWMPHGGLALANSLATSLEGGVLVFIMHKRLKGMYGHYILRSASKALLAASGLGIAIWFWIEKMQAIANWQLVIGGVFLGVVIYSLLLVATGIAEVRIVISWLNKYFKR
jgi:putative peptidoglycan lipid II flippase